MEDAMNLAKFKGKLNTTSTRLFIGGRIIG